MQLPKVGHFISKLKFCFKDSIFFQKCSSFNAESEYQARKFLRTLDFYKNSVFSTSIAEKPWLSGNPTSSVLEKTFQRQKERARRETLTN